VTAAAAVADRCAAARAQFVALGPVGDVLVAVVDALESAAVAGGMALDDPGLLLDAMAVLRGEPGVPQWAAAGLVGKVIAHMGAEADTGARAGQSGPTVAEAVAEYEANSLALMAAGTQHTYRTWTRRLAAGCGARRPGELTAGDLKDLIAAHVLAAPSGGGRRRGGRHAEENAVTAYRSLFGYWVDKGYARVNVAAKLRKPPRPEPRRRPITPTEAALVRTLAAAGQDPALDVLVVMLAERLGLRRIELCRLRVCDVDMAARRLRVWGKGDKERTLPLPERLAAQLQQYLESRRPSAMDPMLWSESEAALLRHPPTATHPDGRAVGRRHIECLYLRLRAAAPSVFAHGDVSLHSYRHAVASFVELAYGRAVTRAVLGHTSRQSPTDTYVHVSFATVAAAVQAYEEHVLAGESEPQSPARSPGHDPGTPHSGPHHGANLLHTGGVGPAAATPDS